MENFEQLLNQYTPMIHKIISSLNIYKNQDEFFQLGMIALWEAYKRFDSEKGKFITYAYPYIKGRMMNEMRVINKVTDSVVYPDEDFWSLIPQEIRVDDEEEVLLYYCREANLTKNQTKWVLYSFFYGLSLNGIAQHEHVSQTAVKSWRRGALQNLRSYLLQNIEEGNRPNDTFVRLIFS